MGGYGSGRTGSRLIAEECLALRVRDLRSLIRGVEQGRTANTIELKWHCAERLVCSIACRLTRSAAATLTLTLRPASSPGFADESLMLAPTPQPQGGRRWWLTCPGCARRSGALFLIAGQWRCRCCATLTYRSSCQSDKRVGPLLRTIAQEWSGAGAEPFASSAEALLHEPKARSSHAWTAALTEMRSLRLLHKAHQLALSRLMRGVPLFRARACIQSS